MRFGRIAWIIGLYSAFASPARADVLEIGPQGAVWVAGGPAAAPAPLPEMPREVVNQDAAPSTVPLAWRPYVAALAAKYDLSSSLVEALVWQESRWNARALSPAGAQGLTQLMPATARQMGVNPRDPLSNLEGGARYLRLQLDAFDGDVEKALAAYNAGPGRVRAADGIPRIRETQNYVASIMDHLSSSVRR